MVQKEKLSVHYHNSINIRFAFLVSRTSSRDLYMDYVYRFHSIYPAHSAPLMVYVGGDNDVGGEGEPVTKEKLTKFKEFFPHKTLYKVNNNKAELVSLNVLSQGAPNLTEIPEPEEKRFRIGVAHIPVLPPFDG